MRGKIHNATELRTDADLTADVVVIGSGPGGSLIAAKLAAEGARVVVLEEGAHIPTSELQMHEESAYPKMYQDGGARATEDLSIVILQGRTVGGGSTVNWMTSLRTPERTLRLWQERKGVEGISVAALAPHFAAVERRLHIHRAEPADVNPNNRVLLNGTETLGYEPTWLPRNTVDCENLGVCSFGCPIDAKQTAASTYLADALANGTQLYAEARGVKLERKGKRVTQVVAEAVDPLTRRATGAAIRVAAERVIVAGGAINTPALLMRSGFDGAALGRRTWLHPVVASVAEFDEPIDAWYGSPQSIACQTFSDRGAKMGFFFEAPPIHPMLGALSTPALGEVHRQKMKRLRYLNALIALTIDGFDGSERGGTVRVNRSGAISLDYALRQRNFEAFREALKTLARIQFAAGAKSVATLHNEPVQMRTVRDIDRIDEARFAANTLSIFSAHQMGGCAMGEDVRGSVVDSRGKMHGVENVWICDGSVFPSGLGVNPMLSIYGIASHFAEAM